MSPARPVSVLPFPPRAPVQALPFLPEPAPARGRGPRILAVDGGEVLAALHRCRRRPDVVLAHGRDLDAALIARLAPRAVVFALFGAQTDALAILGRLARAGHRGRVLALSPPLPNPRMVERELKARHPGLRLRILQILPRAA